MQSNPPIIQIFYELFSTIPQIFWCPCRLIRLASYNFAVTSDVVGSNLLYDHDPLSY